MTSEQMVFKQRRVLLVVHSSVMALLEATLSVDSSIISCLLLMSGDVEQNPGPGRR